MGNRPVSVAFPEERAAPGGDGDIFPKGEPPLGFEGHVAPFLAKYCLECHGAAKARGGLDLEKLTGAAGVLEDRATWEEVARRIEAREMPPRQKQQPAPEEIENVVKWVRAELVRADREARRDPGRVTIRRLNRTEYAATIRDLLGVEYDAREEFPSDEVGYGFDNIGDVLSLSPLLLERYMAAAETISAEAMKPGSEPSRRILGLAPGAPRATAEPEEARLRRILENLASRAFRRPVAPEEVDRLASLARVAEKDGLEEEVRLALQGMLVSPHFLYRVELDPAPDDPEAVHPVTDFELASRLSYFLWSSLPDDELFARARAGVLTSREELVRQALRMLLSPKSKALVENFAAQWLQIRRLETSTPSPALFPGFDESLRDAMLRETELLFETILREDRSLVELLDADFTFLNERLARHYGIPDVRGEEFRRVALPPGPRRGILGHASILTSTSNPTRTSPVKRGKWVLEVLLGAPPPPPPPNVPDLVEGPEAVRSGTLRQRMEQHRADPNCSTCHARMDPIGFGLENFDAVGAWREKEGQFTIDASGELPGGSKFRGPQELRGILGAQKDAFRRALAERLLMYALGRGLEPHDRPAVDGIVKSLADQGDKPSALVIAIVSSDPFRLRRGDRGKP
jgi:mono/diheme cytochrome c family protein